MDDCIFCQLAHKEIPTDVVYEDDTVFAFKDIEPMAKIHYLFIPKKHITSVNDLKEGDAAVVADIFKAIATVAARDGFAETGYRVVTNTGADGNQSVYHLHFHVLGGEPIRFPGFD
ncbi:MAG: histidine triad nucleotide-binding protein [Peptoniphilaceae bacterium]|nr:histidine triad nucleotide-binding protein [Peptoniphilaceae bacterium]MDY6085170.1 histidine triad nucleotide-binding protein [Peptoniphilaceae bacterium]